MYKKDWSDFISEVTWLIKPDNNFSVSETDNYNKTFSPSNEFIYSFPKLTELLLKARLTKIKINQEDFDLLGWTDKNGESFGWLCKATIKELPGNLSKEHRLLLSYFGGLTERWNEQEESWLLNLNSALTCDGSEEGFQGWDSYIADLCREEEIEQSIIPTEYIAIAFEANGNMTLYHKSDSSIIMLAPDHCFEHITPVEGYPEYTLYTIDNCPNLITWVETIAKQELRRLL